MILLKKKKAKPSPLVFVIRLLSAVLIESRQLNTLFVHYPVNSKGFPHAKAAEGLVVVVFFFVFFSMHHMEWADVDPCGRRRAPCVLCQSPTGLRDQLASSAWGSVLSVQVVFSSGGLFLFRLTVGPVESSKHFLLFFFFFFLVLNITD